MISAAWGNWSLLPWCNLTTSSAEMRYRCSLLFFHLVTDWGSSLKARYTARSLSGTSSSSPNSSFYFKRQLWTLLSSVKERYFRLLPWSWEDSELLIPSAWKYLPNAGAQAFARVPPVLQVVSLPGCFHSWELSRRGAANPRSHCEELRTSFEPTRRRDTSVSQMI